MKLNSFLLFSPHSILIVIPLSKLPKYPWSLLYRRINMYFICKEDIAPEIFYRLVLVLLAIYNPLVLFLYEITFFTKAYL
jgi:hypothetical protein